MSYPAVLPSILDLMADREIGATVTAREIAERTGRNFQQIRTAINHAATTRRILMTEALGEETAWIWGGLGPNAKKVDHIRLATPPGLGKAPAEFSPPADAAALAVVQTVGSYALRDAAARDAAKNAEIPALYESVKPLKDGKVLLQDELGNLWVARALDHL